MNSVLVSVKNSVKSVPSLLKKNMTNLALGVLVIVLLAALFNNVTEFREKMCSLWESVMPSVEPLSGSALVVTDTSNEVPEQVETKPKKVSFKKETKALSAKDLLPANSDASASLWAKINPVGEATLKDKNFLVGVDTQGSSLRNANLQLRADPPNPRKSVSPWMNSTIESDPTRNSLC
tara:strand:- start:1378 stop:1914 length:537 start_codon:yes stop_codon:yes gene_type:complete